jgi:recombinational DNA repair protein (RecF pathway)
MDKLMLDGNAVAGLLQEVFGADMTSAIGSCAACGVTEPVGAIHVYRGAGIVLRCPHCDNALAAIVRDERRVWITFQGIRALELAVQPAHALETADFRVL